MKTACRNERMRVLLGSFLFMAVLVSGLAAAEVENGIRIDVARVFTGARTGTRYYGWNGARLTMPDGDGGMLSFDLWNDTPVSGTSVTNRLSVTVAGLRLSIPHRSTVNQIVEPYAQDASWGAGGISRVTLALPPGVQVLEFSTEGSQTGIEMSNLRYERPYHSLPGGFILSAIRDPGLPVVEAGRTFRGARSGKQYYGYSGAVIHLPVTSGGFLAFKVWNDQPKENTPVLNRITVTVGARKDSFTQYSTPLDLEEVYVEDASWGPGGGAEVSVQVPEGTDRITIDNSGSETGIELGDIVFSTGSPLAVSFKEKVRTEGAVIVNLGRVFTGAVTGKQYFGWDSGVIILPNLKGGLLRLRVWNDHQEGVIATGNRLVLKAGTVTQGFDIISTMATRPEVYKEDRAWGPGGGVLVEFRVPAGVGRVEVSRGPGSATGIELTDAVFVSDWRQ